MILHVTSHDPLQVIVQHGGSVVDSYDSDKCTHLLALHKKSDTFAKVCLPAHLLVMVKVT